MYTFTGEIPLNMNKIHSGKVRDTYFHQGYRILVTTDRQSAFDINVGAVPYKGQVLNQISAWWFRHTEDIVPNHLIGVPDPNCMIIKPAKMFPIEVIVRSYITGSTDTSLWVNYERGVRDFCGNKLPTGLVKNQKLDHLMITPTTKPEIGHDVPISPSEIIAQGLVSAKKWEKITEYALALFERGRIIAKTRGLIFVDTKYEFGEDQEGNIIVCDEVNTPDSSRYWLANSYTDRFNNHLEPESLDKEFLRLYLKNNNYDETNIDKLPSTVFEELSEKYIALYEKITDKKFNKTENYDEIPQRIKKNLQLYFST